MATRLCTLLGFLFLLVIDLGCATSSRHDLQLSRLRREIRQVRGEMKTIKAELGRLTGQMDLVRARKKSNRKKYGPAHADELHATTSRPVEMKLPKLPVVRLNAQDPEHDHTPVLIKLGPSTQLPVDHSVLKKKDPVLSRAKETSRNAVSPKKGSDELKAGYEAALAMLRVQNRPKAARKMFQRLRKEHPNSSLTVNISYWLAESHYKTGNQTAAIDTFLNVAEAFPRSPKAAHALLRVAQIWQKRGNQSKATEVFTKIANKYPGSDAAPMAQSALASNEKKVQQ
jgi:tol-pal system protein YbgF